MKNIINTEQAPAAIGPYVQAIETEGFVYTSGQLGIDISTGKLAEGVEKQTETALHNLEAILKESGLTLANVVKTTVFVQSLEDFAVVNTVYGNIFGKDVPARSCVEVAKLPMGGLVEIECVAVRK